MRTRRQKMIEDPHLLGQLGEWLAHDHLLDNGFDVLARNWKAPFGEVDLIARRDGCYHFVEVKTRHPNPHFRPEDSVTVDKQDQYYRLAAYFLKEHRLHQVPVRYDIISVEFDEGGRHRLSMIENAF